ncbi:MAG: insulinase family protein, partial [Bacteroidota bacterium]
IMMGQESLSNRMMRLGRQELYFQRYYTLDEVIEHIEAVTVEDVQHLAQTLFQPEAFSRAVLLPASA